jgi:hypothetical protein
MFRKASGDEETLEQNDCHQKLRLQFKKEIDDEVNAEGLHISIAYDWVFEGHTKEGIVRETMWGLMSIIRNRRNTGVNLAKELSEGDTGEVANRVKSLAQTELALLFLADQLKLQKKKYSLLAPIIASVIRRQLWIIRYAEEMAGAQGEVAAANTATAAGKGIGKAKAKGKSMLETLVGLITVERNVPDTKQSASVPGVIQPYAPDFECTYCQLELANCYFHCNVSEICFERLTELATTYAVLKCLT